MNSIGPLVMEIEHHNDFFANPAMNQTQWSSADTSISYKLQIHKNINMMLYLLHQSSVEAHTLQSCSTTQYSETVEYEALTPSGYRVMMT